MHAYCCPLRRGGNEPTSLGAYSATTTLRREGVASFSYLMQPLLGQKRPPRVLATEHSSYINVVDHALLHSTHRPSTGSLHPSFAHFHHALDSCPVLSPARPCRRRHVVHSLLNIHSPPVRPPFGPTLPTNLIAVTAMLLIHKRSTLPTFLLPQSQ